MFTGTPNAFNFCHILVDNKNCLKKYVTICKSDANLERADGSIDIYPLRVTTNAIRVVYYKPQL